MMTMLLKVDAPTLAAAKKGQSITATLLKTDDGWLLKNITPVATPLTFSTLDATFSPRSAEVAQGGLY